MMLWETMYQKLVVENAALRARLKRISEIIEFVEHRCMAVDGPVTKTRGEITDDEFREIYQLATGADEKPA